MGLHSFPKFIVDNYEIHEWKHASTILRGDFREEWIDIINTLKDFRINKSWIDVGGGRKSKVAEWIDSHLSQKGWVEKSFDTKMVVDNIENLSPTHKIDCYKNRIALEIE